MKKNKKSLFIASIDTDSGKTLVSTILCKASDYCYFKVVQSGEPQDRDFVLKYLDNANKVLENGYTLKQALSPHIAAQRQGLQVDAQRIIKQISGKHPLIIESAGGLCSPLTNDLTMFDFSAMLNVDLVLVINFYLGSINHTILTLDFILHHRVAIGLFVINGSDQSDSLQIILPKIKQVCNKLFALKVIDEIPKIFYLPQAKEIDQTFIAEQANRVQKYL